MAYIDNFTKEELEKIVKESCSFRELAKKLGYASIGNNTDTIKSRLEKYNISTEHFTGVAKGVTKRTKENVFCENSTASQSTLRKWYIKGNYSEYKCAICGLSPFWNGKDLTLTLDHINGHNHDNRLENLRWICPNCDRQLPTFAGRNPESHITYLDDYRESKKNYCLNCGVEITQGATYCKDCFYKEQRKVERPDKEQLLKDLQETNFLQTGKKYGVTDNTIRKWCKAYGMSTKAGDYKEKTEKKLKQPQVIYKVQQINKITGEVINTFNSCKEAESVTGIYHIYEACNPDNPTRKSAGGYIWKRVE